MVLCSQPGSGLNSQRACEHARSKNSAVRRCETVTTSGPLKPAVASRTKLWWISSLSDRSKKGLPPQACGAISGQRSDGGSDEGKAARLVKLQPPSKVGDPCTRKKRLLGWSQ